MEKTKKRITFIGNNKFLFGLNELSSQLNFTICDDGYVINAIKVDGNTLTVENGESCAMIFYPNDNCFFRGFSLALQYLNKTNKITVKNLLHDVGTMQNCSEAVLKVETLKDVIRQSAIMGYTYIGIYTELTYQVAEEPYIGYKAGAYSTEELKEVVDYANNFFIEAVPYIQTISHLNQLFRWSAYAEVKDTGDVLLADYERSYELIENMIKSLRKAYNTSRINLGMDEAYGIGTGRYRWFINEENVDTIEIFIRHLKKVLAIAEKYGFTQPEIWFDNIFGMKFKGYIYPPDWLFNDFDKKIKEEFPKVKLNLWYYATNTQEEMRRIIKNVRTLSKDISFSTVIHGYSSFAPLNGFAEKACDFVKDTCANNNIDTVLITNWGIVTPLAMTAGYYKFIESFVNSSGYSFEERAKFIFGNNYEELKFLDSPNEVDFEIKKENMNEYNPPYYILAEDSFLGIMETNIPDVAKEYYQETEKRFENLERKGGKFKELFRYEKMMCSALKEKAPLSKMVKECYDKKDEILLEKVLTQIDKAITAISEFHAEFRRFWLSQFKSFGIELFDMRFGGVTQRLKIVQETLKDYFNGKIKAIEELEEKRLPFAKGTENKIVCNANWDKIALGRNMRV